MAAPTYIHDYAYPLPQERIAQTPASARDTSKLLVYKDDSIVDDRFCNLHHHLLAGSALVFNNSRVIPARLLFKTNSGSMVELLCFAPISPLDYEQSLHSEDGCTWQCMAGGLHRWKNGALHLAFARNGSAQQLSAALLDSAAGQVIVEFKWNAIGCTFAEILQLCGATPLPPYIHRSPAEVDSSSYQTIYARYDGSAAAPTAGLHFTDKVLASLQQKNITMAHITLHVGAGTFLPVKTTTADAHIMHAERFTISASTLEWLLEHLGNVTAVGTTTARTLESVYWMGVKLLLTGALPPSIEQWDAYSDSNATANDVDAHSAISTLLRCLNERKLPQIECSTALMILPHYRFKVISALLTNFHQPQSTLLLLVAAAVGSAWRSIYDHALSSGYRFLSYGDSSLLHLPSSHAR